MRSIAYFLSLIILLLIHVEIIAQKTEHKNAKFPQSFLQKMQLADSTRESLFEIIVDDKISFSDFIKSKKIKLKIVRIYDPANTFLVYAKWSDIRKYFYADNNIVFINEKEIAKEELQISGFDLSANKINTVHNNFPQLTGEGLTVSVKENKPDSNDIDLKARFIFNPLQSPVVASHATIMATMIAGAGNSYYNSKGVATAANITSSDFAFLLPDPDANFQQYHISVQNHSYGTAVDNFYGADAAAYDISTINNPTLLHVFSSGNSGNISGTTGMYAGINNYANLTGSFKMAKNIITVGATDSFSMAAALSSKGPAYDGRIKPELVAFGVEGSSGAAALVSGVALLLQQQYKAMNNVLPPNSLVKAILLNSADDAGNKQPDYATGFGSLNAENAVKTLQQNRIFSGAVSNGASQNFIINIPAGIKKVKVMLVWNDPAAQPNAAKALVNDLDLELINIASAQTWFPWVLSSYPHADSLQKIAVRKKDDLNNTEQITVEDPQAGAYKIFVKGFNVTTASQNFSIAYQFDSADIFEWNYPTASDFIFPAVSNTLRWNNSYTATTGKLAYSTDNGNNWQTINDAVPLANNFFRWTPPSITSLALLKMTIGSNEFVSNVFPVSARTQTGVGFNCPDSFLFYWNKIPGVINYQVYALGNKYLEPFLTTPDSFLILKKSVNPSLYYAVAPLLGVKEGIKSYTLNYTLQGVDCYIRSFISSISNNVATLFVTLGSDYNINSIILEKFNGITFQPIKTSSDFHDLSVTFIDSSLTKGLNIYRIKLQTSSGAIYSQQETVYYFTKGNYIVYPNPVLQQNDLRIASQIIDIALMEVFNASGVKVYQKILNERVNVIPANTLRRGIYFMRITNNGAVEDMMKFVVY